MQRKDPVSLVRITLLAFAAVVAVQFAAVAQDYSVLRINEVLADNRTTEPRDVGGGTPDMVEIYNTGSEILTLGLGPLDGSETHKTMSIALGDALTLPAANEPALWTFADGLDAGNTRIILPGDSTIVFCDSSSCEGGCEPHASFRIDDDGGDVISLWGPEGLPGVRPLIDQVYLPPLRADVSFGRKADGDGRPLGPAPVPLEETFDHFVFFPRGQTTFGSCTIVAEAGCSCNLGDLPRRRCSGGDNGPSGGDLSPRVSRSTQSTNSPAANEPVAFTARVRDDVESTPPNIASVEIIYRVEIDDVVGEEQTVAMVYNSDAGILTGATDVPPRPLDRWTLWNGEIPGQPDGSRVHFYFRVVDAADLSSTRPVVLCGSVDVGPCRGNFGGLGGDEGCVTDLLSTACNNPAFDGRGFIECEAYLTYAVGYEPRAEIRGVVINEVVPWQTFAGLRYPDRSDNDGSVCGSSKSPAPDAPEYCCFANDSAGDDCPYDDFLELYNGTDAPVNLSGCWLSDGFFRPKGWQFPDNSWIKPDDYVIVWLDDDGAKCPDEAKDPRPCFYECPDPNILRGPEDKEASVFHTNFQLSADNDQIFLWDTEENNFGLIHGMAFAHPDTIAESDVSYTLCPNGDRNGDFRLVSGADATPEADNHSACGDPQVVFRRGDANTDCAVDIADAVTILGWLFLGSSAPSCVDAADTDDMGDNNLTDAVFLLAWLFQGGSAPPPPGPDPAGPDPTDDNLPECIYAKKCR